MYLAFKDKRYIKKVLLGSLVAASVLTIIAYKDLQFSITSGTFSAEHLCHLKTPGIGIRADSKILDQFNVTSPPLSKAGKAFLSLNKMGFDTISVSQTWVAEKFLDLCKEYPKEYVLDVGAGYGSLSRQALSKGVYVISNDIEIRHLLYNRKKVKDPEECLRLFLNRNPFPHLDIPDGSLRAVMLHRILQFMSGKEIDIGLDNVKRWLKPGGKVFIVIMSSEHIAYRKEFLPIFEKRKKEGDLWPGMYLDVPKHLSAQAYALPDKLHVMDQEVLKRSLERHGFQIERIGYVSMQGFGVEPERDGKEAVGAIGVKPE